MHVLYGYDHVPAAARGATLAIGNFDGVHRGHQALLARAQAQAKTLRGPAGVIVFEPHPRELFQPDRPHFRLTPLPEKLRLLEASGLDLTVVLDFDHRLASLSADDFIERILVAGLGVRHVVIGYDFHFGKGRTGTPETMQKAGREMGFGVSIIEQVGGGEIFSSSAIRAELAQGDVRGAAEMLGHWWRVTGTVTGGAKRGTGLGYPTANILLASGTTLAHGIYAVRVDVAGATHDGAAYLGTRPTFDDGKPVLEIFLFGFDGDLYGREIGVTFIDFIRPDQRFETVDALKAQMDRDCRRAQEILAQRGPRPVIAS
jgi:riboflavin kinase/FMN adenylyltransferase